MNKNLTFIKIINAVAFTIMVAVNALANILPINNIATGEVSDAYPNLFAPAGITFSIWGIIYLLLAVFVLYSFGAFQKKEERSDESVRRIKYCFALSSVVNSLWIFAWHYQKIGLSLILMVLLFSVLVLAYRRIQKTGLPKKDRIFAGIAFSVYFGWITIALIANVTTYLVSIGWDGMACSDNMWMILTVVIGLVLAGINIIKFKDIAYGLVIIWAYIGILIKHLSPAGFDGKYIGVIVVVECSLFLLAVISTAAVVRAKNHPELKKQ